MFFSECSGRNRKGIKREGPTRPSQEAALVPSMSATSAPSIRAVRHLSRHLSRAPHRARRAPTTHRRPIAPSNSSTKDSNPMGSFPEGGLAALDQTDLPAMRQACLKVATDAAKLGAAVMLDKLGADVVKTKANTRDLLTEVDPEVQRIIESAVSNAFPTHGFLGEESVPGGWEAGSEAIATLLETGPDWLWIVDPIDGTTNFVHGMPVSFFLHLHGQGRFD